MLKIWIGVLIIIGLITPNIFAEDMSSYFTNGLVNGRIIQDEYFNNLTINYISGVIDCAFRYDYAKMDSFYHKCRIGDIVDAVIGYYRNNPTLRYRPILDVILSGCK